MVEGNSQNTFKKKKKINKGIYIKIIIKWYLLTEKIL